MKCLKLAASRSMPHYRLNCSLFHRFSILHLKSITYIFGTKLEQSAREVYHHHLIDHDPVCISFFVKPLLAQNSMIIIY